MELIDRDRLARRRAILPRVTGRAVRRKLGHENVILTASSIIRYGFSRTTGVRSITVYGFSGQSPFGGLIVPTKTMFQFPPRHSPNSVLRLNHCCCEPEVIMPSIFESARNPPLDQPPSQRLMSPLMCTRRIDTPCETAQVLMLFSRVGMTAKFSTARQN